MEYRNEYQFSAKNLQRVTRRWFEETVATWKNPMIATLTYPRGKLSEYDSKHEQLKIISRKQVVNDLRFFHHKLSRMVYKNAYKKYAKRVNWIPIIEGDGDTLHAHLILNIPVFSIGGITSPDNGKLKFISKLWDWRNEIEPYDDQDFWISYTTKFQTKFGNYSDNILFELM